MANFYEELNIPASSTHEEITRAYKSLAKKYHPDLYTGDKAAGAKKMAAVNAAYETLSDPEKRDLYDRQNNLNQPALNYYEELGVGSKANSEEITRAYKILARKYHPDIYQGDKEIGARKMTAVNNAYAVLADKEKRKKYDRKLYGNYTVDKPKKKFPLIAVLAAVAVVVVAVIITLVMLDSAPEYFVTFTTDGNCDLNGNANQTVKEGSNSSPVAAVPKSGYLFIGWQDETGTIIFNNSPLVIPDVKKDYTLKAICAEAVTVSYTAGANGTVSGDVLSGKVVKGSTLTVTAVPNAGYVFDGWSDGVTSAERTDTANGNISVTATFKAAKYSIAFLVGENGNLFVNDKQEGDYIYQDRDYNYSLPEIKAVANSGYVFIGWRDNDTGEIVSTEEIWPENKVTRNINVTAIFEPA